MFYEKKYTFLPSKDSILDFKADYIKKSYNTDIKYLNSQYKLKKRELYIDDLKNSILILKKEIKDMKTSRSWLLTRPLRKISQSTKIRSSNER
jgi:capsule polysaccharide modification protein KpsS